MTNTYLILRKYEYILSIPTWKFEQNTKTTHKQNYTKLTEILSFTSYMWIYFLVFVSKQMVLTLTNGFKVFVVGKGFEQNIWFHVRVL